MSKVCSDCQFSIQDFPDLFCTVRKLSTKDGLFVNCHHYLPKTLFDRLMASPEVLAPKLVYSVLAEDICTGTKTRYYYSTITEHRYDEEVEAIAATMVKLKEVYNETPST